jgi:shikimate kinase
MSQSKNIFFVGLMGAGKTTIGKQLAKRLRKKFYDTDHEIEKRTGVKIPVIFDLEGESGFRKRESAVIKELTQLENIVLATGGGAILKQKTLECLKSHGYVIYLRATSNDLWQRMRHDKQRPLLQNVDIRTKLEDLYQERHPLYMEAADLVIDTAQQHALVVIKQIEQAIKKL